MLRRQTLGALPPPTQEESEDVIQKPELQQRTPIVDEPDTTTYEDVTYEEEVTASVLADASKN
eukprot:6197280-Pleurochrysis_carterae.AAC.2